MTILITGVAGFIGAHVANHTEHSINGQAIKHLEEAQAGDLERTWADIDRARAELDYDPKVGLKDGLVRFADRFLPRWQR